MTVLTKERRRTAGWVFVGICVGSVVVLVLTVVVNTSRSSSKTVDLAQAIRTTQKSNTALNTTNTQLLQIIHSCLTPGQPCYQAGQAQRAQTAKGTQRSAAAAAACAASLPDPTYRAVYRCARAALAHDHAS